MSLTHLPIFLMLMSAVLHATIGVLMKQSLDKTLFRAMLALASAVSVIPLLFFLPPPPPAAWTYLLIGAGLHFLYQLAQIKAFETGDMSLVYPVMRGSAPALAALFAYFILGEALGVYEIAGLLIASITLIAFGLSGAKPTRAQQKAQISAIGFALFCGVMTALYAVIDAGGIRITRESQIIALSYIAWFFLLDGIGLPLVALLKEGRSILTKARPDMKRALIANILSLIGYSAALYAFALAPVGKMAALRETSVVFGAVFAAFILKEAFGGRRVLLAIILALGLILMQFG